MYQVFWKNWLNEWVTDSKKFKVRSSAVRHSKKFFKQSQNGNIAIQEI